MATMTIRIPDDKHSRLKALARHRHMSVNKLVEELRLKPLQSLIVKYDFAPWLFVVI